MTNALERNLAYVKDNGSRFLQELVAWCAIPSVSKMTEHEADMRRAAEWGAERLRQAGLQNVAILATAGHPVIYGDWLGAGAGRPTVLVYGHYDVQPAIDLSLWESPPFEPQQRGEHLYARGASDMKGQTIAAIAAVEAHLHAGGSLPINVKFLIEGEEEMGSLNFDELIRRERARLSADYSLNNDAGMPLPQRPNVRVGLRGLVRIDLTAYGPRADVHSGVFGGVLHNPLQALCELIAGMHDERGRVTLPGFYDRVLALDQSEREELARFPRDERDFLQATGASALWGEPEFTPYERTVIRPTLEVHAIHASPGGTSVMTIVPARATAALSMRIVPEQDPRECYQSLVRYLEAHAMPDVRWEATMIGGGRATLIDRRAPGVQALHRALQATWGVAPLFGRGGASVTAVSQLQDEMGMWSVGAGFGLPDDNVHGPNERLHLPTWRKGIQALTRFFVEAAAPGGGDG